MLQMESKQHPWQLVLRFIIGLYIVRVVRKAVRVMAQASGADVSEAQDIELAVGEALANVYNHVDAQAPGQITVQLRSAEGSIEILVENEGSDLYPELNIPATLPAVGHGGRGLYLMNQLMDTVEILRPRGKRVGAAVRMTKRLAYAHAA